MASTAIAFGTPMPAGDYVLREGDTMPRPGAKVWIVATPIRAPQEDGTVADVGLWSVACWVRTAPKAKANGLTLDGYAQFVSAQSEDFVAATVAVLGVCQAYRLDVQAYPTTEQARRAGAPDDLLKIVRQPTGEFLHPAAGGSNVPALLQKLHVLTLAMRAMQDRLAGRKAAAGGVAPVVAVPVVAVPAAVAPTAVTPTAPTTSAAATTPTNPPVEAPPLTTPIEVAPAPAAVAAPPAAAAPAVPVPVPVPAPVPAPAPAPVKRPRKATPPKPPRPTGTTP